jgi:antitoxin FitA
MADLLIRNVESGVIKNLKILAKHHHRSLQNELKCIIEGATKLSMEEVKNTSVFWHKKYSGKSFTDSTELLRKDRDR